MKTKKWMKCFTETLLVAALMLCMLPVSVKADSDDVMPTAVSVTRTEKSVTVGDEFTLHAKTTPADADDDYLKWSIKEGKDVIRFEDSDRTGDDMDFVAKKVGTARVCVKIRGTSVKAYVTVTVQEASADGTIRAAGKTVRSVELGDDFDLKVKKSGNVSGKKLKWSIQNSKYVDFEPGENKKGVEAEFIAKKIGTTTISCKNTVTGQTVTFTIHVVDDDDDDDDDD